MRSVSRWVWLLSSVSVLTGSVASAQSAADAGAAAPVARPAQAPAASPFTGVWRFAGGDAERRAFEASVSRTVQGMGWIVEGIAASRLRERSPIPDVITIRVENNVIEYTGVRGRLFRTPADGTSVQTTNPQGEPISLTTRITGNQMVRLGSRADGSRREVLTVNGNTLVIEGTVTSPRLPRPLTYRFTYRK
ncbi:MAG: hypothetical protein U0269_12535 [Polyangiales bacterium]